MKMKTLAAAGLLTAALYAGSLSNIQASISGIVTQADQQFDQGVSTVIGTASSGATIGSAYLEQTEATINKETELVSSGGSNGVFQNTKATTTMEIIPQAAPAAGGVAANYDFFFVGGGEFPSINLSNGKFTSALTFKGYQDTLYFNGGRIKLDRITNRWTGSTIVINNAFKTYTWSIAGKSWSSTNYVDMKIVPDGKNLTIYERWFPHGPQYRDFATWRESATLIYHPEKGTFGYINFQAMLRFSLIQNGFCLSANYSTQSSKQCIYYR